MSMKAHRSPTDKRLSAPTRWQSRLETEREPAAPDVLVEVEVRNSGARPLKKYF